MKRYENNDHKKQILIKFINYTCVFVVEMNEMHISFNIQLNRDVLIHPVPKLNHDPGN